MTHARNRSGSVARVSDAVGRTLRSLRGRHVLLAAPLVFLPPASSSEEDSMLVVASAGEVESSTAVREAVRHAADRYVAWESRTVRGETGALGRADVAKGIQLIGDAGQAAGDAVLGSALSEVLLALQWHGAQLATRASDAVFSDYADAGHVHTAFMHAARLLGALPDAPSGVTETLTRAATAVDERPLPAQGTEVRAFFRKASAALAATARP